MDDQENLCWVIARLLSERGHTVRTAQAGSQALAIADSFDFQVAVVDFRLPDTSGLLLLARLRVKQPGMRAILMTSYGSPALREDLRAGGLTAYFDKPFVNTLMVEAIEQAISQEEPA